MALGITSLSRDKGWEGQQVVITGTDLTPVYKVTVVGVEAEFTVDSATQITFEVPGGITGLPNSSGGVVVYVKDEGNPDITANKAFTVIKFVDPHEHVSTMDTGPATPVESPPRMFQPHELGERGIGAGRAPQPDLDSISPSTGAEGDTITATGSDGIPFGAKVAFLDSDGALIADAQPADSYPTATTATFKVPGDEIVEDSGSVDVALASGGGVSDAKTLTRSDGA